MSVESVIEIEHLSFRYGDQPVLEDVSLSVQRGEFLGVIGPNGGGKTTLLRVLLGLEREFEGRVRIFGQDPRRGIEWRKRVGVVPQLQALPPRFPARARDVVDLGAQVRGGPRLSSVERRTRTNDALAQVGASAYAAQPVWKLSGGQRQRVFVARALVARPELLLLDEPTVGVDAEGQDLLLEWISSWRRERDLTVVLITHDIGVIAPLADKLACLNRQLHFHDRPEHLTGETIERAYGCPARVVFHSGGSMPHVVLGEHHHTH